MTPEQYAREYLEKHGMIPGHDFVPATALDSAAQLYTDFIDDDLSLNPKSEAEPLPNLLDPKIDWFGGEL